MNFCRTRARKRKCKLAGLHCDFCTNLSPRYRSGFEHAGNLMQLRDDFWEIATKIALESHRNRNEIAVTKVALESATRIASKFIYSKFILRSDFRCETDKSGWTGL